MTEYLSSAPVVATCSVEEAREAVSRIYLRHDLSSRDGAMHMRLNATAGDRLTLGYLTYQADAELTMPPTEDCYIVNLTIAGATRAARGDGVRERTAGGQRGLVLTPVKSHRVQWTADAEQLHLKISRARLESHLADMLGGPVTKVIDFEFGLDLTSGPGRGLLESVRFLAAELDRPAGLAGMALARGQLEAYVLSCLLYAGRHQFSTVLADPHSARSLGRLAPVLQYIEANADSDLTPESLARVAGVSVRTLNAAFQDQPANRRWHTSAGSGLAAFAPNCFEAIPRRCASRTLRCGGASCTCRGSPSSTASSSTSCRPSRSTADPPPFRSNSAAGPHRQELRAAKNGYFCAVSG